MERDPHDINEAFNFGEKLVERRHEYKVIYESDPNDPPEEFADVERDIEEHFDTPRVLLKQTHRNPRSNINQAKMLRKGFRNLARYKRHK